MKLIEKNGKPDIIEATKKISKSIQKELSKPSKVLILADDNGVNFNRILRTKLDNNSYEITSIIKPGAKLFHVIENIDTLTTNLNTSDYVIIIGGQNDIEDKSYPSFKFILEKVKLCTHTNVILLSIPYGKDKTLYRNINKFNLKLKEVSEKFDRYIPGSLTFIEYNNFQFTSINKNNVINKIYNEICFKKINTKTLVFIPLQNDYRIQNQASTLIDLRTRNDDYIDLTEDTVSPTQNLVDEHFL